MKALELKSISKSFDGIKILENIDFSVEKGEKVCMFGPSGCGKSSLLYISAGILEPDSGEVLVMGEKCASEEEKLLARRQHFGFIYQFHNLIPELTVLENVLIAQGISGKKDKDLAKHILSELGIYEKRNLSPAVLSGGEAQRTSVARAFASKPSIVFADEPTGSLDPETGEKTMNLIMRLSKEFGTSFLMVSHNYAFKEKFERSVEVRNHNLSQI